VKQLLHGLHRVVRQHRLSEGRHGRCPPLERARPRHPRRPTDVEEPAFPHRVGHLAGEEAAAAGAATEGSGLAVGLEVVSPPGLAFVSADDKERQEHRQHGLDASVLAQEHKRVLVAPRV
jgi:hypothetical protein